MAGTSPIIKEKTWPGNSQLPSPLVAQPVAGLSPNPDKNQINAISSHASGRCRLLSHYIQWQDNRLIRTIPHYIRTRNQAQVLQLTTKESGFRFHPSKIMEAQLIETKIETLSRQMNQHAPYFWRLLANLLASDPATDQRPVHLAFKKACAKTDSTNIQSNDGDISMGDAVRLLNCPFPWCSRSRTFIRIGQSR